MTPVQLTSASGAEVVWQDRERDKKHKGWTVHLQIGAEVIKHNHASAGANTADAELVAMAVEDAKNDGYELNPAAVKVLR